MARVDWEWVQWETSKAALSLSPPPLDRQTAGFMLELNGFVLHRWSFENNNNTNKHQQYQQKRQVSYLLNPEAGIKGRETKAKEMKELKQNYALGKNKKNCLQIRRIKGTEQYGISGRKRGKEKQKKREGRGRGRKG